jgi:undecaprenyl-diphosphatase
MRDELREAAFSRSTPARLKVIALSLLPPAIAGLSLRPFIERRLGGPRSIAAGLASGGLAMALADTHARGWERRAEDANAADGLALGIAQAVALIPGVSRYGATLTAARTRGFSRAGAQALSWDAALPVIVGASALKGGRLARDGAPRDAGTALAAGAASAFLSTLVSARVLRRPGRTRRLMLPCALYRCLLAALVVARLR